MATAASITANIFVPAYREILDGGLATGVTSFFGANALKETIMMGREFHERRLINKRAGRVDRNGKYDDPTFQKQVAEAVEMIGLGNNPTEQAEIAARLYTELDPIRQRKREAFHTQFDNNPDARRQIKEAARELEELDYLMDYHNRWTVRRKIKRMGQTFEGLQQRRREIREKEIFVYVPLNNVYTLKGGAEHYEQGTK